MSPIVISRFLIRVGFGEKLTFVRGMWKSVLSSRTSGDVLSCFVRILTHTVLSRLKTSSALVL